MTLLGAVAAVCASGLLAWRWWLDERRAEWQRRAGEAEARLRASDEATARRLETLEAKARNLDERTSGAGWAKLAR